MTGPTSEGPDAPRRDEPDPWSSSDPTAPGQPPAAEPSSYDPYRFGPPGPNPFGYPHPAQPEQPSPAPSYVPPPPPYPPPPYPPSPYSPPPGYPPYTGGYPPPPPNPYAAPSSGNGRAIAALVLGILSILLFWLSLIDVPLFVLGIIFGILGIRAANRGAGGKGMATAGLVTAIIGAVCCLAFTGFLINRVVDCGNTYDSDTSAYDHCLRNGS